MASSVHQQLSDDHRAVHEVLERLRDTLHSNDIDESYRQLDLFWARLAVHIRAEHLHLFPAVLNRLASSSASAAPELSEAQRVVDHLRSDHDFFMRELARAIGVLRELPRPITSPEDEARFSSVLDVVSEVEKRLENHNDIEENQIYRWAGNILTEPEQTDLATRINAELQNRPSRFSVEAWADND